MTPIKIDLGLILAIVMVCTSFGIGLVIYNIFTAEPIKSITIYKSYQSDNTTFKSLEPIYQIPVEKGTFTWKDWIIEIK